MTALIPTSIRHGLRRTGHGDLFDRFFEDFGLPSFFSEDRAFSPAFDVSETESDFVVKAEVPGIDQKNIDISFSNGLLTVSGEKTHETKDENEHYHTVERSYGSFRRTFRLPAEVDTEKVDATYKDGVLTVTLPKSETVKPKKIEVKS